MSDDNDSLNLFGLGPLEREVMEAVWKSAPASVAEVRAALGDRHAYTTIMTILVRLAEKGQLEREKRGRNYVYSAADSGAAQTGQWLARAIAGVDKRVKGQIVQHFVGSIGDLDEDLLDQLEKEIRDARGRDPS